MVNRFAMISHHFRRAGFRLILLAVTVASLSDQTAFALIVGGEGNTEAFDNSDWPAGAAAVFNSPSRIAWWEGPPLGGGQWYSECRGDAQKLNAVLVDFAKIEAKTKHVIVHGEAGSSFWLNPNYEPAKKLSARIDWRFMVWEAKKLKFQATLPSEIVPVDAKTPDLWPIVEIEIYVGENIQWADVKVPAGLDVIDKR